MRFAADCELSTRSVERHAELLRSVRGALGRVEDGSYGACFECEDQVSPKGLRATPWATLCINCQERADGELRKVA